MRRAVLVLLALALLPAGARAYKPSGPVDAVGMLDYTQGPKFKVGDWVRYHTKGESAQGYKTDYTVTILIAGEERWWGEDCFWVETRTRYPGGHDDVAASLISYSIFEDSLPNRHFQRYIRKFTEGVDGEGHLVQQPFQRAISELVNRGYGEYEPPRTYDTLGVERVDVPAGAMKALHTRELYKESVTKQYGDTTVYFELTENHDYWKSPEVTITGLVRLVQDNTQRRRAWMIGESQDAPLQVVEHSSGSTLLEDRGSGMHSTYLPANVTRPLREQFKPASAPAKASSSARTASKRQ
jgi:hypothetical protein